MATVNFDVAVIGGGIAGVSAAYELAAFASVLLLEREDQLAYHATGRSAALLTENYGNEAIRQLTVASRRFFERPPEVFGSEPLLHPRGVLWIAREDQVAALDRELEMGRRLLPSIHRVNVARARELCPALREDYLAAAMLEPDAMDLDVHAIHQGYLRGLRQRGGTVLTRAEVSGLERVADAWRVSSSAGEVVARTVVNAAGAWAADVGRMAGGLDIALEPRRRTGLIAEVSPPQKMRAWPCVIDVDERFYFKPESGRLMISPADATVVDPCDAQAEELDVAIAVDRFESATILRVRQVKSRWAGLRSFVADGSPVVGPDPLAPGLFWLAGQGGYGVMTAPAVAQLAAGLILEGKMPQALQDTGLDAEALAPSRLTH
jgi:D-arginine dehydrogenase